MLGWFLLTFLHLIRILSCFLRCLFLFSMQGRASRDRGSVGCRSCWATSSRHGWTASSSERWHPSHKWFSSLRNWRPEGSRLLLLWLILLLLTPLFFFFSDFLLLLLLLILIFLLVLLLNWLPFFLRCWLRLLFLLIFFFLLHIFWFLLGSLWLIIWSLSRWKWPKRRYTRTRLHASSTSACHHTWRHCATTSRSTNHSSPSWRRTTKSTTSCWRRICHLTIKIFIAAYSFHRQRRRLQLVPHRHESRTLHQ